MSTAESMTKSLASTPPMGWNSWNMFGVKVNEAAVRAMADAIVETGLKDCGYQYVVIDDCWTVKDRRDSNGDLIPDPQKFPSGMKALADYIHSTGLKFGIYSDAAEMTCASYPGSFGYEEQDTRLWASWGVDFLKYDYCHAPSDQAAAIERYSRMGNALQNCGREILFSICEWGGRSPHLWARKAGGQMWRATGDVVDSWIDVQHHGWWGLGIDSVLDMAVNLHEYAGPGGWNDMDMLVVGLDGQGQVPGSGASNNEYRTQVSMWSLLCSPLMIGCDIRSMRSETAKLLMNREILALNQDALGKQASRIKKTGELEVWCKRLADGSVAVGLLNRGSNGKEITFTAGDVGLLDSHKGVIRDLWKQEDIADFKPSFSCPVDPHGTVVLRISA
jgi:alpha-galactosidase